MTSTTTYKMFMRSRLQSANEKRQFTSIITTLEASNINLFELYQRIRNVEPSCLMENALHARGGTGTSIIAARPIGAFFAFGDNPCVQSYNRNYRFSTNCSGVFATLRNMIAQFSPKRDLGMPHFIGGAVGMFGYDASSIFEPAVLPHPKHINREPDIALYFFSEVIVHDHQTNTLTIIVNVPTYASSQQAYSSARNRMSRYLEIIASGDANPSILDLSPFPTETPVHTNMTREQFQHMVLRVKEHIAKGDVFQTVVSQRFEATLLESPLTAYARLRITNPSPYLFYMECANDVCLFGASPEVMLRVFDGKALIRPLAGTRRVAATDAENIALAHELRTDPKEVAEHSMLVDLARNDMGRITVPATVSVPRMLDVERYGAVMHMVSDVYGNFKPDMNPLDALFCAYPAGTLTGTPKIRAMQIIRELEPTPRGPYGGAFGFVTDDSVDTCIFIRSAYVRGNTIFWQTGGGIVADSVPQNEFNESMAKSISIRKILGGAL